MKNVYEKLAFCVRLFFIVVDIFFFNAGGTLTQKGLLMILWQERFIF